MKVWITEVPISDLYLPFTILGTSLVNVNTYLESTCGWSPSYPSCWKMEDNTNVNLENAGNAVDWTTLVECTFHACMYSLVRTTNSSLVNTLLDEKSKGTFTKWILSGPIPSQLKHENWNWWWLPTWKDAEMVEEVLYTQAPASNFLMHSEELFTVFERVNKNYYAITL